MTRDDLFCAECVGIDLVKLTIHGRNPLRNRTSDRSCAEIIMDRDDVDELIHDLERALRAKVVIT